MSFDLKIIEGDINFSTTDEEGIELVQGYNKVIQDLHKILLTPIGENLFHPGYGSTIGYLSEGSSVNFNDFSRNVQESVYSALNGLIALQQYQVRRQILSPEETIMSINSVNVFLDETDPRLINVIANVTLGDLTELPASVTVKIK